MKAFGAFLAAVWLLFSVTATVQAAPVAEPPCHMAGHMTGISHGAEQSLPATMPCCGQPVVLPDPAVEAPTRHTKVVQRLALPRLTCPAGVSPTCEPQPPKI